MHSDPVCSQVSLPLLALSAVLLLTGLGAGHVLRAALGVPSFLHSCEPPIIHGNLTSDTIFIQHNGLIKIGSGRKLLPWQAPRAGGTSRQEEAAWLGLCGVVCRGAGWAGEARAAGSLRGSPCKADELCSPPFVSFAPRLLTRPLPDRRCRQSGTGCSRTVSVPRHLSPRIPPVLGSTFLPRGAEEPSWALQARGDLCPSGNCCSCPGSRGVSWGASAPRVVCTGRGARGNPGCLGAPVCAHSPGKGLGRAVVHNSPCSLTQPSRTTCEAPSGLRGKSCATCTSFPRSTAVSAGSVCRGAGGGGPRRDAERVLCAARAPSVCGSTDLGRVFVTKAVGRESQKIS